jgi:hypothetical protein
VGPVGGDLGRLAMGAEHRGEEHRRSPAVTFLGHEHVDDLPILIDGPVDVSPRAGDPHVRLIDEPVTPYAVAAWPSRVDEQCRKSLDPSEEGHVVDLDAALSKQLFQVR